MTEEPDSEIAKLKAAMEKIANAPPELIAEASVDVLADWITKLKQKVRLMKHLREQTIKASGTAPQAELGHPKPGSKKR
jgi:hypothetical protein